MKRNGTAVAWLSFSKHPMPRATIHNVTDFIGGGHLNPFVQLSLEFLREHKVKINLEVAVVRIFLSS